MYLRKKSFISENKLFSKIMLVVVAVALATSAVFVLQSDIGSGVNKQQYQLVNLTTGERFIGKLSGLSGKYVLLTDVYLQQDTATSDTKAQVTSTEITVAKLSSSVVKPENTMRIASDKIVHWENLQDDSKVVQAIKQGASKR